MTDDASALGVHAEGTNIDERQQTVAMVEEGDTMNRLEWLCGCAIALVAATPLAAQTADTSSAQDTAPAYGEDVVVTAQRQ